MLNVKVVGVDRYGVRVHGRKVSSTSKPVLFCGLPE